MSVVDPSPRAFSYPDFRKYYFGAVASVNGNWVLRILLAWLAWDISNSPSYVGLIAATSLLPVAIFGPFFGAAIDRTSLRKAFRWASIALMLVPSLLAALIATEALGKFSLFAVAAFSGFVMAAYHPMRQSLGPRLVEKPAIGSVVTLASVNFNVGRLMAPALGGLLIASVGILPTAVLAAVLTIPNVIVSRQIQPRENPPREATTTFFMDLREGISVVWQRWPILSSLLLLIAFGPIRAIAEVLALVADGKFQEGAQGLGLLSSAIGLGALCVAIFQLAIGRRLLRNQFLRHFAMATGFAASAAIVFAPSFQWALLAALITGGASTFFGISLQVGIQERLEDQLRGRVMSLWMLANTLSISAFAFAISWLSEKIGLEIATFTLITLGGLAVVAVLLRQDE